MSRIPKRLVIMLTLLLFLSFILPVYAANQIEEKNSELGDIRDQKKQAEAELAESKQEEITLLGELSLLNNEISKVKAELSAIGRKISDTEEKITSAETELVQAEEDVEEMEELLGIRLRAIYENGQISFLEVLFNSSSFVEFLTRYSDLQMIITQDKELLLEFQREKERIVDMKNQLEEKRQDLLMLRRESLDKHDELENKNNDRRRILLAVRKEIDARESAIRKLEAEAKHIEELIRQLQIKNQGGDVYRGTGSYAWPVPEFGPSWITSGYGYRRDPITGRAGTFHGGIDIGIPHNRWPASRNYIGKPVQVVAADSGIAYTYKMSSGYGNLVIVDHGSGITTVYAHNHGFLVGNGQPVSRGQAISIVGSTGYSTGPHLHFEVRINGERVNPLQYVR